jgi:NitT/TauT family transport system permease protein
MIDTNDRDPETVPKRIEDAVRRAEDASRDNHRRRIWLIRTAQVCSVLIFLLLWEMAVRYGFVRELFSSRPTAVLEFLWNERVSLVRNSVDTFSAALVGFILGSGLGMLAGVALTRWSILERILDPWINFLASLPRIALAPLFLLWFGITFQAKVVLAISVVFFVVLVGTQAGIRSQDPDLKRGVRLLGATDRQIFYKVICPAALPSIFGSLRLAVIFSILGVVASEMVASRLGLGQRIVRASQELEPAGVFGILVILGVTATLINAILAAIDRRLHRWKGDEL